MPMINGTQGTQLITTAEVAAALGVSVQTVARRVQAGALAYAAKAPGLRGAYLFDADAVLAATEAAVAAAEASPLPGSRFRGESSCEWCAASATRRVPIDRGDSLVCDDHARALTGDAA